jgi:putative Holliday junction resolvase
MARVMGIDFGARRVGLAVSDPTGMLARPLATLKVSGDEDAVRQVRREIDRLRGEADGLAAIVVGLPTKLDGSPGDETARVQRFVGQLAQATALPVATSDERLTSREAESRLALHERDWRRRKQKLDAAAAAVILQDYLDRSPRQSETDATR